MRASRKRFGVMLIITALMMMQLPKAEADAATSASDFKMEGTRLVRYIGREKTVYVPDTVEVIGKGAFQENTQIEKVVLPASVKQVQAYAFWGCDNLETVTLGSGLLEVGDFAFANCKGLRRMTIPQTIRSIGIQAFVDCVNMTDINIPPEVTKIHDTAFNGCRRLVIHSEPWSYADKYAQAFYERQKEMPEYEDVPNYQPEENPVNPDGNGGTAAEAGNVLGSTLVVGSQAVVFLDKNKMVVQQDGSLSGSPGADAGENAGGTGSDQNSGGEDAGGNQDTIEIGSDGTGLSKYTIVDGSVVADQAYYRSDGLGSEVVLREGIREIGQFAFARSTIRSVVIPEGVETIAYGAFYHCSRLAQVSLPQTLQSVEPKAFVNTAWVKNFLTGAPTGTDKDFLISGGTLIAYRGNADLVKIPKDVRVIAGEVFQGHDEIKAVVLHDGVRVVGEGAFEDCTGLKTLEIPAFVAKDQEKGLTDIKDRAFAGCPIAQVVLPMSMERIGLRAFDASVQIRYTGEIPKTVHEASAERLSNEAYRAPTEEGDAQSGVIVKGMEGAVAALTGAARQYLLTVQPLPAKADSAMAKAFLRRGEPFPKGISLYELTLTDNSGIPITKLGRQNLIVTIPAPDGLSGQGVAVVTLDRNGQLESVKSERVKAEGRQYIRFITNHLSVYGIYGDGTALSEADILEVTVAVADKAAPLQEGGLPAAFAAAAGSGAGASQPASIGQPKVHFFGWTIPARMQWIMCGVLLMMGTACVLRKGR